ncbi:acyltransferase family protein [Succinivibrio sp.]|uniref:acyltransferase family protein n=1 Tax=Succinivibrio sp. TaxID=2053619 RepID=UPI00386CDFBC
MRIGGGKSNYRSDIDGLRAIACISVVLFHAFPGILRGGFVGVDIFFVISGFLISSILYRNLFNEKSPGKIYIIDFYIRRIRRIFPALIAVLLTTLAIGWFVLLPDEYRLLGKHTIGGATYINNLMLYKESGDYFNPSSNAKPLLHLWSLGIEEQFYLIFPLILWLIYKSKLNFVFLLAVFTLLSFFINKNAVSHNHQTVAFYLPWCRFWELSAGAILAYIIDYHKDALLRIKEKLSTYLPNIIFREKKQSLNENFINNALSVIGLLTIIVGILSIKNDLSFPGKRALVPVIGSLIIIGAGSGAIINKYLLSNRIMIFLGLISYPLYLWHWPFLSLAYICEGRTPEIWIRCAAIGIALVLAIITYFIIEPPLRYGNYSKTKAISLFMTMLFVGFIGYRVMVTDGFKNRFPELLKNKSEKIEIDSHTNKYKNNYKYFAIYDEYIDNCKLEFSNWNDLDVYTTCAMQSKPAQNNVALIGSSHAAHLFYGLSKLSTLDNKSVALFAMGSQSPFINLKIKDGERQYWYTRISDSYNYLEKHKNIKSVILADLGVDYFIDVEDPVEKDFQKIFKKAVIRSLERLKDRKVIIVLDNPALPMDPSKCGISRPYSITKFDSSCTFNEQETSESRELHNAIIKDVVKNYPNVRVVDIAKLFCNKSKCSPVKNGELLYLDDGHLNYKGSKYVAPYIYRYIKENL